MILPAPLISVVLPAYEGAAFGATALQSLLAQGGADFEIILIDDGSQDGSSAIAQSWAQRAMGAAALDAEVYRKMISSR